MRNSEGQFHLCKIYLDETEFFYNKVRHLLLGAILLPIDCDLPVLLGKARRSANYVNTLHYSEWGNRSAPESKAVTGFIRSFLSSSAVYRAIVVNSDTWDSLGSTLSRLRLAGLLLAYPWMPCEGVLYRYLSRARLIFDRMSIPDGQEKRHADRLNMILRRGFTASGKNVQPLEDARVLFSDKRLFDELQLVDILNGVIRTSYLLENGSTNQPEHKIRLHSWLLGKFSGVPSFIEISRNSTAQKINVWHKAPKP